MKTQESPFLNLFFNIIIPSFLLIKGGSYFNPKLTLVIALSFPLIYGIYDFVARKDVNALSILGFVSILLTGGIGLLEADKKWIIIKETSIPLLIALWILIFKSKAKAFISKFLGEIFDMKKILKRVKKKEFESLSSVFIYLVVVSFFISAILNFTLAVLIIQSDPGTAMYNEELGKMTALSFPVIALPSTLFLVGALIWFIKKLKQLSGLSFEELTKNK